MSRFLLRSRLFPTLAVLVTAASLSTVSTAFQTRDELKALDGEWVFVEDRTEGRPLEEQGPPMTGKFSFKTDESGVFLLTGHGGSSKDVRVALDGTPTAVTGTTTITRYTGEWKDGTFSYESDSVRTSDNVSLALIRKSFKVTSEGMEVRVKVREYESVALYRRPQDIPLPTPAKAVIGDMAWLVGAWVGSRGTNGAISIEERWSPAKGGAMLAVSRTVSRERMSAFEFLRIVERDGGLVYIAQPNGAAPTEFVLTELSSSRAVFDNPRHDYPKRIIYELLPEGGLRATIGLMRGGTPGRFEFKREGESSLKH